jgi:alpha-galactosidase
MVASGGFNRLSALVALSLHVSTALDNGLGETPLLGWNTWKTCGDSGCTHDYCDEHEVKTAAEAMAANGMQALGYNYVNLDDCWAYTRDNATGALTWDAERFPSGMNGLADWLHERGFKFGLYTSGGDQTCSDGGRGVPIPGSEGHFEQDAASFAEWGVDYVKFDWCGDVKGVGYALAHGKKYHKEFAAALNATGRPMFLEVVAGYWFLRGETGQYANSWRFCEDHHDDWESTAEAVACRVDQGQTKYFNLTTGEAGAWPYMDFLMTGGNGCAPYEEGVEGMHCPGQTDDEYKSEFGLWAIAQSPLIVATDVRNMTAVMTQALLNEEIIAAHQSTATPAGRLVASGYHRKRGGGKRNGAAAESSSGTSSSSSSSSSSGAPGIPFRVGDDLCVGCEAWARDVVVDGEASTHVVLVNWGVSSALGPSKAKGKGKEAAAGSSSSGGGGSEDVTVTWADLGWAAGAGAAVRDLWSHQDLAPVEPGTADAVTAVALPPGGSAILKLTPT